MFSLTPLSFYLAVALTALHASTVEALVINTPSGLFSCMPVQVSWSGAQPPVYITASPRGDTGANPYKSFPVQNTSEGTFSWTVDLPAGVTTTLGITDGTGARQASAAVLVRDKTSADVQCPKLIDVPKADIGDANGTPDNGSSGSSGTATINQPSGTTNTTGNTGTTTGTATGGASKNTTSTGTNSTTTGSGSTSNSATVTNTTTGGTSSGTSGGGSTVVPNPASRSIRLSVIEEGTMYAFEAIVLTVATAVMIGAWSF